MDAPVVHAESKASCSVSYVDANWGSRGDDFRDLIVQMCPNSACARQTCCCGEKDNAALLRGEVGPSGRYVWL